jgi:hypothetical protein
MGNVDDRSNAGQERNHVASWDHATFVNRVKEAVKTHDIPTAELPNRIDLSGGAIGNLADRMLRETLNDPERRERGSYGKVSLDGKLLINEKITIGQPTSILIDVKNLQEYDFLRPHTSRNEYSALDLHTHGVADVPPSGQDFIGVLKNIEDEGVQASFVITPSSRFLIMRTNETPSRSPEEARAEIQQRNIRIKADAEAEMLKYNQYMRKFGGTSDAQFKAQAAKIEAQFQMKNVLDICHDNNLVLYTSVGNNVFVKAS